jgi:hypothetical protein
MRLRDRLPPTLGLLALPAGYLLAGTLGAVVAGVGVWVAVVLVFGARVPGGLRRRARPQRLASQADAAFPTYRRFLSLVGWAQRSPRHYDHAVRPSLQMLAAARVAERRGLDLYDESGAVAALFGDDWELLDPARPARADSRPPGVPLDRLQRMVARLEDL